MSSFPLVQRRSEEVLEVLRRRLAQDDVVSGSRLPPERNLAVELGVSRRVLREALQILENEGLIERVPGRGTVVLATRDNAEATIPADLRQYTSPRELMDARLALEPVMAGLAAANATSQDIDEMRACVERSRGLASSAEEWEAWDSAFHSAIGRATHNHLLIRFFMVLIAARKQTAWGRLRKASLNPQRQAMYVEQHADILAAIVERDPELATQRMRRHLGTVRRTLIEQLDEV